MESDTHESTVPAAEFIELKSRIHALEELLTISEQCFIKEAERLRDAHAETVELNGRLSLEVQVRRETEKQLAEVNILQSAILNSAAYMIISTTPTGVITSFNPAAERSLGYCAVEVVGKTTPAIIHDPTEIVRRAQTLSVELGHPVEPGFEVFVAKTRLLGEPDENEWTYIAKNGRRFPVWLSVTALKDERRQITGFLGIGDDISEKRRLEGELAQRHKMEAVGQLAAGIAHEINTPTQFVGDNTQFLKDAFSSLLTLIGKYRQLQAAFAERGCDSDLSAEMETVVSQADLDYLMREIPNAISQSADGLQRISKIVRAMKDFSHPDGNEKELTDINRAIETTLIVSRNEWKYVADVETHFDSSLPMVPCLAGEINQVLLNLMVNAAHAIAVTEIVKQGGKGVIRISTCRDGDEVEIRVSDTGTGIAEEHRARIFEPFFTTKEVGKGTGQGLAMAYQIVTKRHGGGIRFQTETGQGTTFIIRLPLKSKNATEDVAKETIS